MTPRTKQATTYPVYGQRPFNSLATTENAPRHGRDASEEKELPVITLEELARHNTETDCWMAVQGEVFNMTLRLRPVDGRPGHPGGVANV